VYFAFWYVHASKELPGVAGGQLWDLCLGPFNRIHFCTVKITKDSAGHHRNCKVSPWISINQHRIYSGFWRNSNGDTTNQPKKTEKKTDIIHVYVHNRYTHAYIMAVLDWFCSVFHHKPHTCRVETQSHANQVLHWALSPKAGWKLEILQETTFEASPIHVASLGEASMIW